MVMLRTKVYQRICARMILADTEPKRTDNRDHVPRKGKGDDALEHRDERCTSRYIVSREASRGEDRPEIHRKLPGVTNAHGGIPLVVFNVNHGQIRPRGVRGITAPETHRLFADGRVLIYG